MPFRTEKQRKFMHARHPEIAAKWEAEEKKVKKSSPDMADLHIPGGLKLTKKKKRIRRKD